MFEALSTSKWRWTWRFLLLCCASVLLFILSAVLGGLLSLPDGGPFFYTEVLSYLGLAAGIIGVVVSCAVTLLRRSSSSRNPVA